MKAVSLSTMMMTFLVCCIDCLRFKTSVESLQQRCFYQILESNQKYEVDIRPRFGDIFSVNFDVLRGTSNNWQTYYTNENVQTFQTLNIHKITQISSTHRFCITNPQSNKKLVFTINISHGAELNDLRLLPNNTDVQNLASEIQWVTQQNKRLEERNTKISSMRENSKFISTILYDRINIFTIIFSIVVMAINGIFFVKMKNGLKAKKMI